MRNTYCCRATSFRGIISIIIPSPPPCRQYIGYRYAHVLVCTYIVRQAGIIIIIIIIIIIVIVKSRNKKPKSNKLRRTIGHPED